MKPLLPTLAALLCVCSGIAQEADMQLFLAKDINFMKPRLIGKAGSHYMVYDESAGWPSAVYTFDSGFNLVNKTRQYIPTRNVAFRVSGNNVYLTWKSQKKDSAKFAASTLDEAGNERWFNQQTFYFPEINSSAPTLVTDINNRYFVYYSVIIDSNHHEFIRAVMLDTAWNIMKTGFYPVQYDRNTMRLTPLIVGSGGDLHFATYDRLGSYRISSLLTMYTIPLNDNGNTIFTKDVGFEKVKFFDLAFVDDTAQQQIKLIGYYYDGQEKTKRGIATLSFPYDQRGTVSSKLYPFPADFEANLRSSLVFLRKKDRPAENLRIKDVFERDGRLFVSNWLVDIPRYQMVLDKDVDMERTEKPRKQGTVGRRSESTPPPSVDGWLQNSANFNRSSSAPLVIDPRNPGVLVGQGYVPVYTSLIGGQVPQYVSSASYNTFEADPELLRQLQSRTAGKLLYFSIDDKGKFQNQIVPYISPFSIGRPSLNNFPVVLNGQLLFLNDVIRTTGDKKNPVLVKQVEITHYNNKGEAGSISSFNTDLLAFFSDPSLIAPGKYLGVYQNRKSGESGIALWQVNNTSAR